MAFSNIILFLSFAALAYTQVCTFAGTTLTAEDALQISEESCTTIEADVTIDEGLDSLTDLKSLTTITGALRINNNPSLRNLNGLESLISLGDLVSIQGNLLLQNVDALSSIARVGQIIISENPSLENVDGLESLAKVDNVLMITSNPMLEDVDGLESVFSVGDSLWIANNTLIENVDALTSLTEIGAYLRIHENPSLENLNGLYKLSYVGGFVMVLNNAKLENIYGLANVQNAAFVQISGNNLDCELPCNQQILSNLRATSEDCDLDSTILEMCADSSATSDETRCGRNEICLTCSDSCEVVDQENSRNGGGRGAFNVTSTVDDSIEDSFATKYQASISLVLVLFRVFFH